MAICIYDASIIYNSVALANTRAETLYALCVFPFTLAAVYSFLFGATVNSWPQYVLAIPLHIGYAMPACMGEMDEPNMTTYSVGAPRTWVLRQTWTMQRCSFPYKPVICWVQIPMRGTGCTKDSQLLYPSPKKIYLYIYIYILYP